jgi:hypothetical protein
MDHEAEWATWRRWSETIAAAGKGVKGVRTVIEDGDPNRLGPTAAFYFEKSWTGPTGQQIQEQLAAQNPSIQVGVGPVFGEVHVSPVALEQGEAELVAKAIRAALKEGR